MNKHKRSFGCRFFLVLIPLLLIGCTGQTVTPQGASGPRGEENPASVNEQGRPFEPPPVLGALLREAKIKYQAGDWSAAITSAERGLRIERRSPALYLLLAQSYLQLQQLGHAENFARQGLRYAHPDSELWLSLQGVVDAAGDVVTPARQ